MIPTTHAAARALPEPACAADHARQTMNLRLANSFLIDSLVDQNVALHRNPRALRDDNPGAEIALCAQAHTISDSNPL
jgi:hypothetical protein